MQNKQLIEGVIVYKPESMKFDSIMVFIKHTYKKYDGTEGSRRYRLEAKGAIAQEIVSNYAQNDLVQVQGISQEAKTKKKNEEGKWVELLDQFGDQVWEKIILVTHIKKLGVAAMTKKPVDTIPKQPPYQAPKQPTPTFKNNPNSSFANQPAPIPIEDSNSVFEEVFEGDLPF